MVMTTAGSQPEQRSPEAVTFHELTAEHEPTARAYFKMFFEEIPASEYGPITIGLKSGRVIQGDLEWVEDGAVGVSSNTIPFDSIETAGWTQLLDTEVKR